MPSNNQGDNAHQQEHQPPQPSLRQKTQSDPEGNNAAEAQAKHDKGGRGVMTRVISSIGKGLSWLFTHPQWAMVLLTVFLYCNAKEQTGISARQAEIAESQTTIQKQSLELISQGHELTRNDQRAWVGIQKFQTRGEIAHLVKEGLPITMNAVWQNFGKGPAFQTDCALGMRIMRKEDEFVATYDKRGTPPVSASALWPGITYATPAASLTPNDRDFAEIRVGTKILYFYGKATYNDAFGEPHRTHFCCRYTPDDPGWLVHHTYNDAN